MSRIQPLTQEQAPSAAQPLLEGVKAKFGGIPNVLGTLAHAPAALQSYLSQGEALASGLLSAAQRERVALAVGEVNGCGYCVAAHTMIGKNSGLDEAETLRARQGDGTEAADRALAHFARRITETRAELPHSEVEEFKAAGFTDGHVIEVIALVAMNTLTNYVNHIAETEIDFPAAPALQTS